ncbi:hypothetical protein BLSTO_01811 [Blastocystis sp. subtype 1]
MVKSAPHKVKPTKVAKTAKETKDAKKEAQPKVKKQKGYARRAVKRAEPKINENPKSAMFIRSTTTSQFVLNVMRDLLRFKKPYGKLMTKKNEIRPFEDINSLEFLSQKNDCSLFMVGSHSKKRPHNLIMGRMFNYQLLDMIELGVLDYKSIESFKSMKSQVGQKPMFLFQSDLWQYSERHMLVKNMILDFFRGEEVSTINLTGLSYVIAVTAIGDESDAKPKIFFRVYSTELKKVAGVCPRVELELMGPSLDLEIRRVHENTTQLKKVALLVPKTVKPTKVKNVTHNVFGEKIGRLHMTKQEVDKMQVRKIKALKILRKEREKKEKTEKKAKE